ncbi:MAG TPA: acyltransferase domain-containing protein, partial [Magnetospirillum sp.]|nr:acyltransferase domain-containing protein [Magnetospirillum sp.]
GVNSFGFGGANAHVLLEEYRAPAPAAAAAAEPEQPVPVVLSARSPEALKQAAARLADALAGDEAPAFHDVAWTLAQRRAHHNHRLLLRTTSTEALLPQLRAAADGEPPATAAKGRIVSPAPKVAFVYSGNGAQWLGMGVQLLAEDSAFRAEVGRIDALVKAQAGWSVIDELHAAPEASRIADTRFSQPLLFAVQAGITASLAARGLSPEAVTGHSVGEVAAAYAAGALNLETAVHVILSRSAAQGKTRGMGRMAAVSIDAERAAAEIAALDGAVEVAAINSPGAVTLSGSEQALLALKEKLAGENIDVRMLDLDYAFHNRVLEPFRDDLIKSLGKLAPAAGTARFYSTVTGARIDGTALDATYWWDNVRQPVRFRQAVQALAADGFDILLEISPHPIIQSYVRQTLRGTSSNGQLVPLVNRQNAGANRLASAVDQAWTLGAKLNWNAIFPQAGTCVDLPTYPWQRERFWFPVTPEARGPMFSRWEGTLLGWRPAPGVPMWETTLDATILPFLADHQVGGAVVFPAAGFIEMTLEASRALFDGDLHDIEQMEIRRPLVLDRCKVVRFSWTPEPGTFQIASRTRMSDEPWSVHVTGRLVKAAHESAPQAPAFVAGKDARQVAPAEHYAFAESIGLVYGPVFQTVGGVTVDGSVALARLKSAGIEHAEQFEMHPALFDGCLQALFNILKDRMQSGDRPHAFLPSQFGRLLIHGDAASAVACRVELKRVSLRSIVADFLLTDADGAVVVEARACRFQRMELGGGAQAPARYGFEVVPLTPHTATAALPPPAPVGKQDADMAELNAVAAAFAAEALAALGKHPVAMGREALAQQVRTLAALPPAGTTADALWRATLAKRPDCLSELTMLGRVGLRLADLLSGADAGAALPAASTVDHFLDASPARAVAHDAVAEAVAAFVATWPSHRRLRVLEVGGGSTGLTRRLLNLLPADGNSYTVAILDPDFVQVAEASLAGRPNRSVVLLDPAAPLAEQPALQAGQYDV